MLSIEANYLFRRMRYQVIILCLLTIMSILFVDKPLCLFLHKHHIDVWALNHGLRYITEYMPLTLLCLSLLLPLCAKPQIAIGMKWVYILYLYILIQLTIIVKQGLKIIFGRYWPQTWINHNLSLIHDNVYGFNWFNGGIGDNGGSFPSGHTTYIAIISLSMAIIYPRSYKFWYLPIVIMVCSLVILNYHFFGDCFAGIMLAVIFANLGFVIYNYFAVRQR